MNHHQRKVLHAIFAHPLKSRVGVTLNGRMTVLHLSSHSLLKAEVMQIRKFFESCGITAEAYPV